MGDLGLLPCPFCGSDDIYTDSNNFMCNGCGISQNDQDQTREQAPIAWNRRHVPDEPKGFNGGYNPDGSYRFHKIDMNASTLEKKQVELDCMTRLKQIQEERTAHWRGLHEIAQDEISRLREDLRTYMSAATKAYADGFRQGHETAVTAAAIGKGGERPMPSSADE